MFGASNDNLFPSYYEPKLDKVYLKKMELTETRIMDKDALFFWQIILNISDSEMSDIGGDSSKLFYFTVKTFINKYIRCGSQEAQWHL